MQKTPPILSIRQRSEFSDLGEDYVDFLKILGGPTQINVKGEDPTRCRAIVTLLHGNERSGLKAIHRILRENVEPATDLCIVIASVNAALHSPILSHRFLPWEADMNRCFNPSCGHDQGQLARRIIASLNSRPLEALVDTHNTSAHSEPFTVATRNTPAIQQLSQLFANNLVVLDQVLNTLIEQCETRAPWITVEFGGLMDAAADALAFESLCTFITAKEILDRSAPSSPEPWNSSEPLAPEKLKVLKHPLRLEIHDDTRLHYSSSVVDDSDVTMFNTIDQLNFRVVESNTPLGWLGLNGLDKFHTRSREGIHHIDSFFHEHDGFLTTSRTVTLFMATTDPYIAKQDCLFYFAFDNHHR